VKPGGPWLPRWYHYLADKKETFLGSPKTWAAEEKVKVKEVRNPGAQNIQGGGRGKEA